MRLIIGQRNGKPNDDGKFHLGGARKISNLYHSGDWGYQEKAGAPNKARIVTDRDAHPFPLMNRPSSCQCKIEHLVDLSAV